MRLIGRSDTLKRALEVLADVCGPAHLYGQGIVGEPEVAVPHLEPSGWREDFLKWALDRCVFQDRCFGGISALHADFAEWSLAHEAVPCTRDVLESLIREVGLLMADGLVSGLILRGDFESATSHVEVHESAIGSRCAPVAGSWYGIRTDEAEILSNDLMHDRRKMLRPA